MNKREIGTEHEQQACLKLQSEGLRILETNYRKKIGEIDIIAMEGNVLVFVEVKYRTSKNQGGAFYAISAKKQQTITRVAQWYLAEHGINPKSLCRFDAVLIDGGEISHIRNAW